MTPDGPDHNLDSTAFFAEIYDRFYDRIYNYVYFRCQDADLSDDLTALVFERALSALDRYDPAQGLPEQWLFTIARNALFDHWRRSRRMRWVSLDFIRAAPAPDTSPEQRLLADEESRALARALKKLPERERDILGLKFAGRLTNRQIARMTGLKENHVAVIVYRAVGKLRVQLTRNET